MANYPDISTTAYGGQGAAGSAQAAANSFIPIAWHRELLVSREPKLQLVDRLTRINFIGRKGDTLRIPFFSNLTTSDFTPGVAVIPQVNAEGKKDLIVNQHVYSAVQLDDVLAMQADYNLRAEFNKQMGIALAKDLETKCWKALVGTDYKGTSAALSTTYRVIGGDGETAYADAGTGNASDLTDAGLRRVIRRLKDNNVPDNMDEWALIIPPSQEEALLGIDKFVLYQNIGSTDPLRRGLIGRLYGVPVFVSSFCPRFLAADGVTYNRVAIMLHKSAMAVGVQMNPRFQTQYKVEYLANLMVADQLYGVKALRTDDTDVSSSNYRLSHACAIYTK